MTPSEIAQIVRLLESLGFQVTVTRKNPPTLTVTIASAFTTTHTQQ